MVLFWSFLRPINSPSQTLKETVCDDVAIYYDDFYSDGYDDDGEHKCKHQSLQSNLLMSR